MIPDGQDDIDCGCVGVSSDLIPGSAAVGSGVGNDRSQGLRTLENHTLPAPVDPAPLLPTTEPATDGEDCGTGHFRNVAARQRKIDRNTVVRSTAGAIREAEQRPGEALIDMLRGHLDDTVLRFLQLFSDGLERIGGKKRKTH